MNTNTLELEQIFDQEIEVCLHLEKYMTDKREFLIKGDIDGLSKTDLKLEKYNAILEKLEKRRQEIYPTRSQEPKIKAKRNKLKDLLLKIDQQNTINSELLKHALQIVEKSIQSITQILVPESGSYNNKGRVNQADSKEIISSIIHDV